MIAWDFRGLDVEDSDVRAAMKRESPLRRLRRLLFSGCLPNIAKAPSRNQSAKQQESQEKPCPPQMSKHVSFSDQPTAPIQNLTSPGEMDIDMEHEQDTIYTEPTTHVDEDTDATSLPSHVVRKPRSKILAKHAKTFAVEWSSPRCLAIIIGLTIALVNPLKGLFTPVPSAHIPNAPDGEPPLAFILDTATFIGNASVPFGLICLGSALARMRMPRGNYKDLPLGAIVSLAVGKLIVMPVVGLLICQGLARARVIDPSDKVLRFVCM